MSKLLFKTIALSLLFATAGFAAEYLSPEYMALSRDGKNIYCTAATAKKILILDAVSGEMRSEIKLAVNPSGVAVASDGTLYVCGGDFIGELFKVSAAGRVLGSVRVGHTPIAPVLSYDQQSLYVACRFNNAVVKVNTATMTVEGSIQVLREPHALTLGADGKLLFVANHLPAVRATDDVVAASVSVIDTATDSVIKEVMLPNGSTGVRGICATPDGSVIYVTHTFGRYQLPTTQLERGWMNTAGLSILDGQSGEYINTVLLDDVDLGSANPWGVTVSPCGKYLFVAHAGTSELSIIDRAALHERLAKAAKGEKVTEVTYGSDAVPNDLSFLVSIRRRVRLNGNGPHGVVATKSNVFVALYYSDTLAKIQFDAEHPRPVEVAFGSAPDLARDRVRRGEMLWNDGSMCFQQWQSCASCHPDGRADGLNWDLLNDGTGNPKQTKSMLYSHLTPPTMVTGIRPDMESCNRKGLTHIQFVVRPEEDALCIDAYVKSLKPVPSPYLVLSQGFLGLGKGELTLSKEAKRGAKIFVSAGCAGCHPPSNKGPDGELLFTNLKKYDLELGVGNEEGREFDTTTLVEVWRTAPYLYDGRALTITEMLTTCNPNDTHGLTQTLQPDEIQALAEYILSY
ncbi:MAG: c-type cytochrome [Kiritimatiellae bacterium]|nr:c-type cytochrome [Kiritimatiellia bacterium]